MDAPSTAILDAAVSAVPAKPAIMPNGVRRWIPAAVPMLDDGSPVSAEFIADMAATLNAEAVSIPIDGGSFGSVAHMTASTEAVGWAHRAAVIDGALFLEAEVAPEIDAAIEAGRLAYSSIDADYEADDAGAYVPGTARLVTHGLTNTPKNRGIPAMQSIAATVRRRTLHAYTRAALAGETMATKKKQDAAPAAEAPVVETVQASTEVAEATETAPAQAAEAPAMTLEEAMAKIAELETKLAAMEASAAEMSAQLAATPPEPTDEEKMKAARETAAIALVDDAIKAGQVSRASREKFLALARTNVEGTRAALAFIPKRAVRVTDPSPAAPRALASVDLTVAERSLVAGLVAGGKSRDAAMKIVAQKRGEVV